MKPLGRTRPAKSLRTSWLHASGASVVVFAAFRGYAGSHWLGLRTEDCLGLSMVDMSKLNDYDPKNMGGCQYYGPLLGPLNTGCRIRLRTQSGTLILTTTHMDDKFESNCPYYTILYYTILYNNIPYCPLDFMGPLKSSSGP